MEHDESNLLEFVKILKTWGPWGREKMDACAGWEIRTHIFEFVRASVEELGDMRPDCYKLGSWVKKYPLLPTINWPWQN